jgi:serine/threonine-protein kinase
LVRTSLVVAGRYQLLELVGQGGAGRVWRAVDETLAREVAVKVIDVGPDPGATAARRFEREMRATARMAHPNIVTVLDGGFDDDWAYLVMELLAGPSFDELVRVQGPLSVPDALAYASQACAGLTAAHNAGIVHRDLKPANLVLDDGGTLKVVDFGIARLQASATAMTQTDLTAAGTVLGTTAFLAPEQASDGWVDARADLYALGCVMFFVLTGIPPFEGDTPVAVAAQHLHAPVPSVRDRRPDVTAAVDLFVRDLLAKDPDRRPQRAVDAAARIRALQGLVATARPTRTLRESHTTLPAAAAATTATWAGPPVEATEQVPSSGATGGASPPAGPLKPGRAGRWGAFLVAVVALLTVAVALASSDHGHGKHGAASAPASRPSSMSTVAPTTVPETTSTATTAPPTTVGPLSASDAAAQLAAAAQQASASGELVPQAVAGLTAQIADLERAVAVGKPGQVGHVVADLASRIDSLVAGGDLTPGGEAAIAAPLATLERLYPSARRGGGDQGNENG